MSHLASTYILFQHGFNGSGVRRNCCEQRKFLVSTPRILAATSEGFWALRWNDLALMRLCELPECLCRAVILFIV
jgi:hypothetical protein